MTEKQQKIDNLVRKAIDMFNAKENILFPMI